MEYLYIKQKRPSFVRAFIIAIIFFAVGFFVGQNYQGIEGTSRLQLSKVSDVYQRLQELYLFRNEIDPVTLEYGAIRGLVEAAGDPYTYFLDPKESGDFDDMINGSFQGIGAEIGLNDERQITIIAPLEGAPAKRAGLQPQDVVLQIDDKLTTTMTLDEAVGFIRGPKGSRVTLLIRRLSLPDPIKISIVRDLIEIPIANVKYVSGGAIAFIQLYNFNEHSADRFAEIAQQVLGSTSKKIILDLRGNPGGILQEAIRIAGWFVDQGQIVVSEKSSDGTTKEYRSDGPAKLKGLPLVILTDRGSASASEILAGALRAHDKATLAGEKTFGKGTVQILEKFSDGSSLRVTISRWLLPDGSSINKEGIAPDVLISNEGAQKGQDRQLDKAIEILK